MVYGCRMAKRSYHQYCGLAVALDVVGERWAMLVVRDLVPGPRRFKDLFDGLPGIATDVLAERLRGLEAAGAVEQLELRHPVPAKVYALTERGHELARIGGDLAAWGMPLLPPARSGAGGDYRTNPRWALQAMTRRYRGGLGEGEYRWTIGDDELRVEISGDAATIGYGHGEGDPLLDVRCTPRAFFAMVRTGEPSDQAELRHGSRRLLARHLRAMPIGPGAPAARHG